MIKFFLAAIAGLALAGAVFGSAAAEGEARVRVVHASPDAPNVDVYANGAQVLSDVPFKAASDYLAVPAGAYTFEVFAAGATDSPVLSVDADLSGGMDYTVVALGEVASLQAGLFVDDNSAPASGKAHVSVIHASPDAPAVDIAVQDGPVLINSLAFGESAGPLPVDAGSYDLAVLAAGTDTVALPLDGVSLESGDVYTVIAVGLLAGDPDLSVLVLSETPAPAATMSPPATGDAGLAAQSSGGASWQLLAIGAGVLALAGLATRRALVTRR